MSRIQLAKKARKRTRIQRKKGEHRMADCGGYPRCVTCGADEDTAFTGGQPCHYGYDLGVWYKEVYGGDISAAK